jgi:hypothetical protein
MDAMHRTSLRRAVGAVIAFVVAGVAWSRDRIRARPLSRSALWAGRKARDGWIGRPGKRRRYLRQLASKPLPNLYEAHPEARQATPREIGLRSIDLDDIAGTAVGGHTQRGADFKPLPAFRSQNWDARWQRIRGAIDRLAILPPIDVVRYPPGGRYWILDGHNRAAAALDVGQVEIDANVVELVLPGQNPSERPDNLAAALAGTRSLRAAGQGGRLQSVADDVVLGVPGREDGQGSTPGTAERRPRSTPARPPGEGDRPPVEPPTPS